jgi:hypothetical protein
VNFVNERPRAFVNFGARVAAIAIALLGALAACEAQPAPPLRAEPVREPAAPGARVEVRALIVRIGVRVAESFPPQYFADITSALPDGCSRFARSAVRREGTTLFVDVFNTRPAGDEMACTMIYGEHEESLALGSDFAPGITYTLDVNGTRQTFVAQ